MRHFSFFILAAALCTMFAATGEHVFHVSPQGQDAWSGTQEQPNADKTDGPLATLAGARDAVRKLKQAGPLDAPVRVVVHSGNYTVTSPVTFSPEDSGTAQAPVSYEGAAGERPVLNGGRLITGWKVEDGRWVVELPEVRDGNWRFGALWVNGERRTLARTPNPTHLAGDYPEKSDFFYTDGPVKVPDGKGAEMKSTSILKFRAGDIQTWAGLEDAIFVVFHSWETSLHRVKTLDLSNSTVEFTGAAPWGFSDWNPQQRYYVENLFEGLDQPGEWCLRAKEGKLYYMPFPNETPENVEVVAPVANQLIVLEGKPAEGKFVEYLDFRRLNLAYTEEPVEPQGHADSQAEVSLPAAFECLGARNCTIEDTSIGHVGNYGVWFRQGSQNNKLSRSEVFDLGGGGVRLGESGSPTSDNEVAGNNTVDNCFVHDGGRIFRGGIGVWVGRTSNNAITHNEVCDFRYSGMSIGWSWGYDVSSANHNRVEFNHIHDIGKAQLSDLGGIYTLGDSPGTVLRNNYIHDVIANPEVSCGWGLYTDEGSTGILLENNVIINTSHGGFHQHYGKENRVVNNIFALAHKEQIIRSRQEEHLSFFFEHNIVYYNNGRLLGSNWGNGRYVMDYNLYWDTSGQPTVFAGKSLAEWQSSGYDTHSLVADPLFVDPANRDFRLKPDSPALKLAFQPIDVKQAGLYGSVEWTAKPGQVQRIPAPMP